VQPVVDTLLLGCTHYPLLRSVIERVAGPGVRVVDSAATTALAVREVLLSHRLVRTAAGPTHRVFATGPTDRFRDVARTIFGEDLPTVEQATMPTAASARPG
jgi:glutamate racemase